LWCYSHAMTDIQSRLRAFHEPYKRGSKSTSGAIPPFLTMFNTEQINILVTGATGYIGGSVLHRLLKHPDASKFRITSVVRAKDKAAKLENFGIKTVVGSHSDKRLMRKLAADADVIFAMADADDVGAAEATLTGLKDRYEATGQKSTLIHTSGTGTLSQTGKIFDDSDPDQIESLPATQVHRNVDLMIVEADKQGYVNTYIVLPSTVYGIATGPLVDQGIQKAHSIQIPLFIQAGIRRGQGALVGEEGYVWPHVSNDDVADLYITLYNAIVNQHPAAGHGREGYYFGENGEYNIHDVARLVSAHLAAHGVGSPEPTPFTQEELEQNTYFGTNSQCRGNRSRAIGWNPQHTTTDFLRSIKLEVDAIFANMQRGYIRTL
jgi:nucleoside-diphosphate-sugar epimerase